MTAQLSHDAIEQGVLNPELLKLHQIPIATPEGLLNPPSTNPPWYARLRAAPWPLLTVD